MKMMWPQEIRAEVAAIAALDGDVETAHARADRLHIEVLKAIAAGAPYADQLAGAALETETLTFQRSTA